MFLTKSKTHGVQDEVIFSAPKSASTEREKRWLDDRLTRGRSERFIESGVKLTPALAEMMLAKNTANRPQNQTYVKDLAGRIARGEWRQTHQGLAFNRAGVLLDGQHRTAAVILAGRPIDVDCCFGCDADEFEVVDIGRKRSVGDTFALNGETDCTALAAAVSVAFSHDNGGIPLQVRVTPTQAAEYLDKNPSIRESVPFGRKVYSEFRGPMGTYIALHFLFSRLDRWAADQFFTAAAAGENLAKTRAEFRLRKRMLDHSSRINVMSRNELAAVWIKAWNLTRTNERRANLVWRADESFPVIL